jgi:hypothetical protein
VPRGAQLRPRGAQARRAKEGADSSDHPAAEAAHPDAKIALRYCNELELLVAVMLSAQTTDVNVNRVTETLFEKYRRPETTSPSPLEELERDMSSVSKMAAGRSFIAMPIRSPLIGRRNRSSRRRSRA